MPENYISDSTFDSKESLTKGEYEGYTFNGCNFSDSDLSGNKFSDCTFKGCNTNLRYTIFDS